MMPPPGMGQQQTQKWASGMQQRLRSQGQDPGAYGFNPGAPMQGDITPQARAAGVGELPQGGSYSAPRVPNMSAYAPGRASPIPPQSQGTPYQPFSTQQSANIGGVPTTFTNTQYQNNPLGNFGNASPQYRPAPFSQSSVGIDGTQFANQGDSRSQIDAMISRINEARAPWFAGSGTFNGNVSPQRQPYDFQDMMGQANQMVVQGWRNPLADNPGSALVGPPLPGQPPAYGSMGTMSFVPGTSDQYRQQAYGNWAQQQGYGPQVMGYGTDSFGNTIRNVLGYQGLSVRAEYGQPSPSIPNYGSQNPSVEYAPGFGQPGYMGPGYGSPGYMGQAGPEVNTGYMPPKSSRPMPPSQGTPYYPGFPTPPGRPQFADPDYAKWRSQQVTDMMARGPEEERRREEAMYQRYLRERGGVSPPASPPGYMGQAGPELNTGYIPPTRKGEMYNPNPPGSPEWWAYKHQQDAAAMAARPREWGPEDYAKRDRQILARGGTPSAPQAPAPSASRRTDPQEAANKAAYGKDGTGPFNESDARAAYYAANRDNVRNYYRTPQGKKEWGRLDGAMKAMYRAYGSS